MRLNPPQREAVCYVEGPLLVLAGAGSGKTRVIAHKIAHLIERCGMAAPRIAAVTFTNKAAREMKARVAKLLPGPASEGLTVSTFHTLGLQILRREHGRVGLKGGFSILDAQDSESLIKELAERHPRLRTQPPAALQWRISQWKNALTSPEQAEGLVADGLEAATATLYADYRRTLRAYNAVDFDDLILLPASLFQSDAEVLETWRERLHYLLVDEYQDTNGAQYALVKAIAGRHGRFTAVGDDDQSIYAWRGARPENLKALGRDFPHLKVIALEQNYRSSGRILRLANRLITHNPHLFEKRLWSELGAGEPARVLPCRDETHEAERVVSEILHQRQMEQRGFGDFAILYRGNHQARPFEQALRVHNIPYVLSGGTSFFERSEVKDVMAYLRLLVNPRDDAAFLRIVNTPRREIGPTSLERLAAYAQQRGVPLLQACSELGLQASLGERPGRRLAQFAGWISGHARAARSDPLASVRRLIDEMGYRAWIGEQSSSERVAERRWANVTDLLGWLDALEQGAIQERTLDAMVSHLSVMDLLERQNEEQGGDRIHLMTLHAAKGLEFPVVFLVGMEEDLLPHRTSIESGDVEEERRLAYVGITRARQQILFSYAERRRRGGEAVRCEPSRFLGELPQEELVWSRSGAAPDQTQRERGSAHLARLKGLLGTDS